MSEAGYAVFDTTVAKTNQILHEIEEANGWPKERRELSYHALRAVLHAIRDRLTVEEANDFAAQLPMLVRGLYFEGWRPASVPIKMDAQEFLQRIREEFVFEYEGGIETLVQIVLVVLSTHMTGGEMKDMIAMLPDDIIGLLGP